VTSARISLLSQQQTEELRVDETRSSLQAGGPAFHTLASHLTTSPKFSLHRKPALPVRHLQVHQQPERAAHSGWLQHNHNHIAFRQSANWQPTSGTECFFPLCSIHRRRIIHCPCSSHRL